MTIYIVQITNVESWLECNKDELIEELKNIDPVFSTLEKAKEYVLLNITEEILYDNTFESDPNEWREPPEELEWVDDVDGIIVYTHEDTGVEYKIRPMEPDEWIEKTKVGIKFHRKRLEMMKP